VLVAAQAGQEHAAQHGLAGPHLAADPDEALAAVERDTQRVQRFAVSRVAKKKPVSGVSENGAWDSP